MFNLQPPLIQWPSGLFLIYRPHSGADFKHGYIDQLYYIQFLLQLLKIFPHGTSVFTLTFIFPGGELLTL